MNLKMLFIINDNENKIIKLVNKYKLPFNVVTHGEGTASKSMLDYFGLIGTEKIVNMSIISDLLEEKIFDYLKKNLNLEEIGKGIAFTIPLTSSSKYLVDAFNVKDVKEKMEDKMENKINYHLIMVIVNEGYAEKTMTAAKRVGANGGTVLHARGLGGKNSFKFFNMTIEPEKDIILIVCGNENKNKIMEEVLDKVGIKTKAKGICISLPIENVYGINE